MRYLTLLLLPLLLAGCATVSTTKTIEVIPQPGVDHIVVDTNASARCKDIFFIITCRLNVEMTPVGGVDSTIATAPLAKATSTGTTAKDSASSRLTELDELKKKQLISVDEYKVKRNEILRGL
ncbi:hypothetical protein LZ634_04410 [Kluyvera intermedia]|uniref:hypothetical protein n=1 Tax=Kluyvera intermedia TaxID=61648 RepID=UPI001F450ED2|nr:hypothetical protein [Kluyvera intermedia]EKU4732687.1 hypothetical protein [Kluyvera ascorbata]MCE9887955.1 hypothetical protein [Kluyvera intermedia]